MVNIKEQKCVVKQIFKDINGNNHMIFHYQSENGSYFSGENLASSVDDLDFAIAFTENFNPAKVLPCMVFKGLSSKCIGKGKPSNELSIFIGIDACNDEIFALANNLIDEVLKTCGIYCSVLDRTNEDINILLREQLDAEVNKEADEILRNML